MEESADLTSEQSLELGDFNLDSVLISTFLKSSGFNHCMMKYSILIDSSSSNPFSLEIFNIDRFLEYV